MLKRVERHRQKKQDADGLALDEQWQQILGFHDTDSDESASENSEDDDHAETSDNGGSVDPSESEGGEDHEMTVSQALSDPLYAAASLQPGVMACIICPGKIIKGPKMEELHLTSNAHVRRFNHFSRLAADAKPTGSAQSLFRTYTKNTLGVDSTKNISKRAAKRKIYHARKKERRRKFKERQAKKADQAVLSASEPVEIIPSSGSKKNRTSISTPDENLAMTDSMEQTSPAKKKRKIKELSASSEKPPSSKKTRTTNQRESINDSTTSVEKGSEKGTVAGIVRSTADRANKARLKARSSLKRGAGKYV